MPRDSTTDRRSFLKYTSATAVTAAGISLSGCIGDDDDGDGVDDDGTADGVDDDGAAVDPALDEVTITMSVFPNTIDPQDHITGDYFNIFDHIYEPLFDFEIGEGIAPRVVTDWDHQGDGSTELTIKDDVLFHNGDTLTADDVAWTINRTVDPELGVASPVGGFGMGSIEGAEALDDTTLVVEYSGSAGLGEFEYGNYARALNREWALGYDADQGEIVGDSAEDFNGTGPYEVVEFEPDVEIVVERFDDYHGPEPPFEQITFNANSESSGRVNALEAGETDLTINILPEDVTTVQNADGIDIRQVTSFRNIFCPMKNTVEPFDSLDFRRAMNYAVDNEEIIRTVLSGFGSPMSQPVAPGVNGHNPDLEPYEQDIGLAESLVEDSGYGGVEIELYAPQGRYLNDAEVGETVADQIDQLDNVNCEANIVEFSVVSDANSAGIDPDEFEIPFFMIGWGVITGDTDYGTSGFFVNDEAFQTFRDDELSQAILDSRQITDTEERTAQLQEVNRLAHEKAPWIFLHQQESIYGVNEQITWEPREDESVFAWEMS